MGGIMRQNSKKSNMKLFLIPLIIFVLIKALWVVVEVLWLPSSGIDYIDNQNIKPLYYRVRVDKPKIKKVTKAKIKKPVSSIKDIKLLAIYLSSDDVVITAVYKGRSKILAIGDKINGFTLVGAESTYAILSKNNKNYKIELPKSKSSNKSTITVVKSNQSSSKKSINDAVRDDGGVKVIDKETFRHFTTNINDIYKNIGIKDITVGDKKKFKVSFIKRDSIFSKLGLRRGDIIKSVNGEEIDSYAKAFNIYKEATNMTDLSLVVERNNKEVELEYEID
jgi:general secretion pathway protein C